MGEKVGEEGTNYTEDKAGEILDSRMREGEEIEEQLEQEEEDEQDEQDEVEN